MTQFQLARELKNFQIFPDKVTAEGAGPDPWLHAVLVRRCLGTLPPVGIVRFQVA